MEWLRVRIPAGTAGEFSSPVNFVCWLLFGVRSTPVLPQWHVKDPGHSAKSAWRQVTPRHAYTLDPTKSEWADYAAVQAYCGKLSGNEITRNSSGNTRPQSSQLSEPLWVDLGLKSGNSGRDLLSTEKKKKKKSQAGNGLSNIFPKSSHVRKKPPLLAQKTFELKYCQISMRKCTQRHPRKHRQIMFFMLVRLQRSTSLEVQEWHILTLKC